MNDYQFQGPSSAAGSAVRQETSKAAILCLVCGILSCIGFGVIGIFIVGLAAGFMALSKIKKSNGKLGGQMPAIIGLILNAIAGALTIVLLAAMLAGFVFYKSNAPRPNSQNGSNSSAPAR